MVDDVAGFAAATWGRRAALTASDRRTNDLFSIDDADAFVSGAVRRPVVRMVRGGSTLPPGSYCTRTRLGGSTFDDVVDPAKVAERITEGATLVMQSLHRQWAPIVEFANALTGEIGHHVQVNAYLTPASSTGLSRHADDHDVFVVQVDGTKWWDVDGIGRMELSPGDVLYVPAGVTHDATTTARPSLHLTVGILRVTYRQVLARLLESAPDTLDTPLPLGFHRDDRPHPGTNGSGRAAPDLDGEIAAALDVFVDHLRSIDPAVVAQRERRRQFVPARGPGHLRSVLAADTVDDDTRLEWRTVAPRMQPTEMHSSVDAPPTTRVLLRDRVLRVPDVAVPAVAALAEAGAMRVGDLPGLDAAGRAVLARRLVLEGACTIA